MRDDSETKDAWKPRKCACVHVCVQVQKEDFITWHHVRVGATLHRNINRVCVSARQDLFNPASFLCASATEYFITLAVRASARESRISQPHVCEFERRVCVCACVCVYVCVCVT